MEREGGGGAGRQTDRERRTKVQACTSSIETFNPTHEGFVKACLVGLSPMTRVCVCVCIYIYTISLQSDCNGETLPDTIVLFVSVFYSAPHPPPLPARLPSPSQPLCICIPSSCQALCICISSPCQALCICILSPCQPLRNRISLHNDVNKTASVCIMMGTKPHQFA